MSVHSLKDLIQNNKIGVAILGLGLVLFVLVAMLAVKKLGGQDSSNQGAISQEEVDAFKNQSVESDKSEPEQRKAVRRKKNIAESEIVGAWDSRIKGERALLQLNKGKYKLIIVPDDGYSSRVYSNGKYTLEGDLLMLFPDLSIPAPESQKFSYEILTRSRFPVVVAKHKGRLIWQVPGDEYDVYIPNHHPFLNRVKDKIAVWKVLK